MDNTAQNLANITVNDQPASEYVEGRRVVAFQRERALTILETKKNIYHYVPKSKPDNPAYQGKVTRRVRYLTDEEIRREKGIMAKPFKTQAENLIYVLTSKAPLTSAEVAKELGMKLENAQGLMSKVTLRLGDHIKKERKGLQFVYMPADPSMTHQQLFTEYLNSSPSKAAKAEVLKKVEDIAAPPEVEGNGAAAEAPANLPNAAPAAQAPNWAALPSISIPANIQVHVKVEVSFKLS